MQKTGRSYGLSPARPHGLRAPSKGCAAMQGGVSPSVGREGEVKAQAICYRPYRSVE